jgi:3-oxoacyl-[acyl-carrier protein] reductase
MQAKLFKGKVALVMGGSRGIRAGIVRRLAEEGVSVAFTYSVPQKRPSNLFAKSNPQAAKRY